MVTALAIGGLATLSILCALAETALFSLGRWQLRRMQETGGAAQRAARLLDHPEDLLSTLSLVNTVANGLLMVTAWILARQRGWSLELTLPTTFAAILIFGEILPKTLAVRAPERWATRTATAAALLQFLTHPLRRLAQALIDRLLSWLVPASVRNLPMTEDEYRELLDMAVQQGALGRSEKEIIDELITLDRKCARDVMRPRATMAAVPDDLPPEELAQLARRLRHRRLPIYDETPDTIVGVLNARQFLLDPEHNLESSLEFPSFVPETMNLLRLFQALQRQKRNLAIVLDEFGAVAGVVRMEDILGEILGPMAAEAPATGFVFEKLGPGRWRTSGSMRLEDFRREFPDLPPHPGVETLGGLMLAQLDIVPPAGATAQIHGLRLTASVVDDRCIRELRIETHTGR